MPLTILSGSPNSGKTRQAYLLAAKVAETGKVLIFTDDDISTIVGRSSWLVGDTWLSAPNPDNIYFNRLFSLPELEDKIEKIKPELVVIDFRLDLINITIDDVEDVVDRTNAEVLVVLHGKPKNTALKNFLLAKESAASFENARQHRAQILQLLFRTWEKFPELRLGQLISNSLPEGTDILHVTDAKLIQLLKDFEAHH